uniref:Ycf13 n=1 Tax=Eutreptia viridis TaxID=96908 RepID=A0A0B5GQ82_9EUGL|nr:ycf13 [Eutreptia viridis]
MSTMFMIDYSVNKNFWKLFSWKKAQNNLFCLQKRLFRSVQVGDIRNSLKIQRLILSSNSTRLLSIRKMTQLSSKRKISGIDGKIFLTFSERFELNEYVRLNCFSWTPQRIKKIPISSRNGQLYLLSILTISDCVWQCLVFFALDPAHESTFHFSNIGFRSFYSVYDAQRLFYLKLNVSAFGSQKRILLVDLEKCFPLRNSSLLMSRLLAPKEIKTGIFSSLNVNVFEGFFNDSQCNFSLLSSLLTNIIINGIENLHSLIRFGSKIFVFLKPFHSEVLISDSFIQYLDQYFCFKSELLSFRVISTEEGFDFEGWTFRLSSQGIFTCVPSYSKYKMFRFTVKQIINNSNYSSKTKAIKLSPIIYNWRNYHRFCNVSVSRNILFSLQKKAFKVFNREVKQNRFSTKRLLDQAFPFVNFVDNFSIHFSYMSCKHIFYYKGIFFCLYCGRLTL